MGHDICCVGTFDNDHRYPNKLIVSSNVTSGMWHRFPKDAIKRKKDRSNWYLKVNRLWTRKLFQDVRFTDGRSKSKSVLNHTGYRIREKKRKKISPKWEGKRPCKRPISSKVTNLGKRLVLGNDKDVHDSGIKETCNSAPIPLAFEYFTREYDVGFYTGFSTIALLKRDFNQVAAKAHVMIYWEVQPKILSGKNKYDTIVTIVQPKWPTTN